MLVPGHKSSLRVCDLAYLPCDPQWNCEISSGRERETKSVIPTTKSTAARKASGCDFCSKEGAYGYLLVSLINVTQLIGSKLPCP